MIHPLFWLFSFETFFNVNSLPFWNYMISSKEGGKSKIGVAVGTHPFSVIGDRDGGLRYMIVQTREWVCNPMYFQPLLALGAAKNIPPTPLPIFLPYSQVFSEREQRILYIRPPNSHLFLSRSILPFSYSLVFTFKLPYPEIHLDVYI